MCVHEYVCMYVRVCICVGKGTSECVSCICVQMYPWGLGQNEEGVSSSPVNHQPGRSKGQRGFEQTDFVNLNKRGAKRVEKETKKRVLTNNIQVAKTRVQLVGQRNPWESVGQAKSGVRDTVSLLTPLMSKWSARGKFGFALDAWGGQS